MGGGATTGHVVLTPVGARVTLALPMCSGCAICPASIGVHKVHKMRSSICLRSRSSEMTAEVSVLVTTFVEFSSEQVVADGALALPTNSGCAKGPVAASVQKVRRWRVALEKQ